MWIGAYNIKENGWWKHPVLCTEVCKVAGKDGVSLAFTGYRGGSVRVLSNLKGRLILVVIGLWQKA
jgi:hypothetical protein